MEHVRMKRISPEEAYDKCLDKKNSGTFSLIRRKKTKPDPF